jgi:hypothetical protein
MIAPRRLQSQTRRRPGSRPAQAMKLGDLLKAAAVAGVLAGCAAGAQGRAETRAPGVDPTEPGAAREVAGVRLPAGPLARQAARAVRAAEGELVYQHSQRVYCWAVLAAQRKGLRFDPDLLYVAAMFHDYGLTAAYGQSHLRYEVDGANAARDFLRGHGRSGADGQTVWLAIALHTTNGISPHLEPIAALLADGANMDLVGAGYGEVRPAQRDAVEAAFPRSADFAPAFLQALYDSLKTRPETTQGTGLADVMAYEDPGFRRRDFSRLMRTSPWVPAPGPP